MLPFHGIAKLAPRDHLRQPLQWLPRIQLLPQARHQERPLPNSFTLFAHGLSFDQISPFLASFPVADIAPPLPPPFVYRLEGSFSGPTRYGAGWFYESVSAFAGWLRLAPCCHRHKRMGIMLGSPIRQRSFASRFH